MAAPNPDLVATARYAEGSGGGEAGAAAPAPASYGKFVPLEVIGRGGMGVVLRARDPDLDRVVALKLLAPERWAGTASSIGVPELQREGQALAKLSHPNVVTIYEMGRVGDQTFIAMELVDGVTLRAWLRERTRAWREIVAIFLACGRGLAAAHRAGLVHRDFKPENVLIGADGRPRVTDFGLVTSGVAVDERAALTDGGELAVEGAVVGTPAYMAPEQWTGGAIDARTDQYAFAVALWEALCGQRPFDGGTTGELRAAVLDGQPRESTRPVPRALRAALQRALARDRDARWPSMEPLLAELERARAGRRRWLVAAGGVGAAGAVAAVVALTLARGPAAASCDGAGRRLGETWNPAVRARVVAAFDGVGRGDEGRRLTAALDAYAARWSGVAVAGCRAARDHAISAALIDQRAACLDASAASLGQLVEVLATADRTVADGAGAAVDRLPDLEGCADVRKLSTTAPLPTAPALRAEAQRIFEQFDAIDASDLRGDPTRARAMAEAAVADARALGHAPTLAIALIKLGNLQSNARELERAEASFREAASVAAEGHDDQMVAQAWIQVLFTVAEQQDGDVPGAAALEPFIEDAVRRAGDPRDLRYNFLMAAGTLAARGERFDDAIARFEQARAVVAGDRRLTAESLGNLARAELQRGDAKVALGHAREAAALVEAELGPDHPDTATALDLIAYLLKEQLKLTEALPISERVLAIEERAFGHDSERVAVTLVARANLLARLRDFAGARRAIDDALAIQGRLGGSPEDRAHALAALANVLSDAGDYAAALPYYVESIPLFAQVEGPAALNTTGMTVRHADALVRLGRCPEARALLDGVAAGLSAVRALDGEALIVRGRCGDARGATSFERAIALCTGADDCMPTTVPEARMRLGMVRRDRALVERARGELAALEGTEALVGEGDQWLRAR